MKVVFFFMLVWFSVTVSAQNQLNFNFDYAQFEYDSVSNYVELYYSFDPQKLTKQTKDELTFVSAILKVTAKDVVKDTNIIERKWKFKKIIPNSKDSAVSKITVGILKFVVPKGSYDLTISLTDTGNPKLKYFGSEKLVCEPFLGKKYKISDIQLAQNIVAHSPNKNSIFFKNTYEVIPNPEIVYSGNLPVLFFYSEIYNLQNYNSSTDIIFTEQIVNSVGNIMYNKNKTIKARVQSAVIADVINLKSFPTDAYVLALILRDSVDNRQFISSKKFFLYNPTVENDSDKVLIKNQYMASEFGVLTEEECDKLFDESKYIATSKEIRQYEKLDSLNAKRSFLFKFWKKRDTFPETRVNEFKNEYMKRVEYCNSHFRALGKEGYKTDRGRVYLQYGPPDQIDRYPNELNMKPYEIWQYQSIEGGVIFVFGDITGYADYELLHSTKRGELRDEYWQRRIRAR